MFRITPERTDGHVVLKVEGRVSADALDELDACWRTLTAEPGAPPVWIDLSDASLVGTIGLDRLACMHRAGVRLVARGCLMREYIREIVHAPRSSERCQPSEGAGVP